MHFALSIGNALDFFFFFKSKYSSLSLKKRKEKENGGNYLKPQNALTLGKEKARGKTAPRMIEVGPQQEVSNVKVKQAHVVEDLGQIG